jgi:hypothetical protein
MTLSEPPYKRKMMPSYKYKYFRRLVNTALQLKHSINHLDKSPVSNILDGFWRNPENKKIFIEQQEHLIKTCYIVLNNPERFKK